MKIVLVTGARGFVGRHLAAAAHSEGAYVCGIGHGAWPELEREAWGVSYWLNGDVTKRNLDILQSSVGVPNVIFHLAGGSSVASSLVAPEEDFHRTTLSTLELLEWSRSAAKDLQLVLASSAAVYGDGHNNAIAEGDRVAPYSPYGYHKHIAEELFECYGKNFGLNVAIVRLFSVYGQELRKQLLWDACGRLRHDRKKLVLGGTGNEVRDWLHITDAAQLMCSVADHANPECYVINGGTGIPTTVRQIGEILCAAWGAETNLVFSGVGRHGDPKYLVADPTRMRALGFHPTINPEAGIASYVEWFNRVNAKAY